MQRPHVHHTTEKDVLFFFYSYDFLCTPEGKDYYSLNPIKKKNYYALPRIRIFSLDHVTPRELYRIQFGNELFFHPEPIYRMKFKYYKKKKKFDTSGITYK